MSDAVADSEPIGELRLVPVDYLPPLEPGGYVTEWDEDDNEVSHLLLKKGLAVRTTVSPEGEILIAGVVEVSERFGEVTALDNDGTSGEAA